MSKADIKVVLLGSETVGKTSLMVRYIHDRFNGRIPHISTIGAAFASKAVISRGQEFFIGIWDTAGSERYYSMSRLYYRGAKAAVICFDITDLDSLDRAKQWVQELKNHEENCKIYICGTKKDIVDSGLKERAISKEKAMQYARGFEAAYIETSSKTGENVDELFRKIADECVLPPVKTNEDTIKLQLNPKAFSCCSSA